MSRPLICLAILLLAASGIRAENRPNIVFTFADDWGRYASIYSELEPGSPADVVKTPNFDRIAREGVLFRNAFVNAPSCTPCRSSLLSGQYFWRTGRGAILQGAEWDAKIPSYPLLLEAKGYYIGFNSKVWGPGTPANAPYGGAEKAFGKRGSKFNDFSEFVSRRDDIEAAKQELYDEVRGNFTDFLAAREPGQPFCYWWGPTNCHRKWVQGSGKKLWGIDPDSLQGKLPPYLPDIPIVREDFADYLGEVQALDTGLGVLIDELEQRGELGNTIIVVSGDHGVPGMPRGKCNLYDLGTRVSLAIRWGGAVGGRVVDDFVCLPDLAPTFLEAAGETPPEVMTGRSLMNVLTSTKTGLVDEARDYVVVGRERHVAHVREGHLPYPQRAFRTKDFLYIRNFAPERWPLGEGPGYGKPEADFPTYENLRDETYAAFGDIDASPSKAWISIHRDEPDMKYFFNIMAGLRPGEELYDLRTDPHCVNNLVTASSHQEQREELSRRLLQVLESTGDPRVTGDGKTFDRSPFSDPVDRR